MANVLLRQSLNLWFLGFMVLSLYFIKLGGSLPIRTVYGLALVAFIFIFVSRRSVTAFFTDNKVIGVALMLGLAGSFATFAGKGSLSDVINYNIKWIIQPLVIMCLAYQVCHCLGPKRVFSIIALTYCVTLLVAVLQGLEFNPAWEWRYSIYSIQDLGKEVRAFDDIEFQSYDGTFDDASRARGLSWSAIHLSYQGCLLIGMLMLSVVDRRYQPIKLRPAITLSLSLLALLAVVMSGTRSALFGVMMLPFIYYFWKSQSKLVYFMFAVLACVVLMTVLPLIQEMFDLRVLQTRDSSASMRLPLYLFGLYLFLEQPWGYGWIDQSINYAQDYWQYFRHMQGAESIFLRGLHNYLLNIVWVYGVFGLFALAILFWVMRASYGMLFIIALSPYLINSLFHNGGIFYGGNYIWVFIGLAKYLRDQRLLVRNTQFVSSKDQYSPTQAFVNKVTA